MATLNSKSKKMIYWFSTLLTHFLAHTDGGAAVQLVSISKVGFNLLSNDTLCQDLNPQSTAWSMTTPEPLPPYQNNILMNSVLVLNICKMYKLKYKNNFYLSWNKFSVTLLLNRFWLRPVIYFQISWLGLSRGCVVNNKWQEECQK